MLRQVKARLNAVKHKPNAVLVIERFDAEGATLEQVRQMFGFPIVTIAKIEAELAKIEAEAEAAREQAEARP